ncbi:MAG TPA: hypothetical protein VM925_21785 [Labilithrix sp.]|jgi:hypothetical protein|nr:hypothetical protein [Labilithrix sp.]
MSSWVFGSRYRFKVVQGQVVLKKTPNTGTKLIEVMCEVSTGPMETRRVPYTGYLNSPQNAARTRQDLINMGWKGSKWGDWSGLFSGKEFEGAVMADENNGKTYPRVAFPRPIRRVNTDNALRVDDLDKLNEELGDFEQLDAISEAQAHDRDVALAGGYDDDFPS